MTDQPEVRPSWEDLDLGQWSPDESIRLEVAEELLGLLCGWSGEQLRVEKSSAHPDPQRLAALRAQHEDHLARRRQLATLDDAGVRQVLEKYGPVARRLLGKE
jgi:hypothetical protein